MLFINLQYFIEQNNSTTVKLLLIKNNLLNWLNTSDERVNIVKSKYIRTNNKIKNNL